MLSETFRRSSNEDYTLLLRMVGLDRLNSRFLIPGATTFALLIGVLAISLLRGGTDAGMGSAAPSFSLAQFSTSFLSDYWFEFELTSVFLVAAIVAALAVIKVSRRSNG